MASFCQQLPKRWDEDLKGLDSDQHAGGLNHSKNRYAVLCMCYQSKTPKIFQSDLAVVAENPEEHPARSTKDVAPEVMVPRNPSRNKLFIDGILHTHVPDTIHRLPTPSIGPMGISILWGESLPTPLPGIPGVRSRATDRRNLVQFLPSQIVHNHLGPKKTARCGWKDVKEILGT